MEWDDGITSIICLPVNLPDPTQPGKIVPHATWTIMNRETEDVAPERLIPQGRMPSLYNEHIHKIAEEAFADEPELRNLVSVTTDTFARPIWDHPVGQRPGSITFPGIAIVGEAAAPFRPYTAISTAITAMHADQLGRSLSSASLQGWDDVAARGLETWAFRMQQRIDNTGRLLASADCLLGLPPGPAATERRPPDERLIERLAEPFVRDDGIMFL